MRMLKVRYGRSLQLGAHRLFSPQVRVLILDLTVLD